MEYLNWIFGSRSLSGPHVSAGKWHLYHSQNSRGACYPTRDVKMKIKKAWKRFCRRLARGKKWKKAWRKLRDLP